MNEIRMFVIALYVPDSTAKALSGDIALQRLILDGSAELDFISPGWWESSHTARLGLLPEAENGDAPAVSEVLHLARRES